MDLQLSPLTSRRLAATVAWLSNRFELQRGGGGHNNSSMEGLRGLAVFLVFLVHYGSCASLWHQVSPTTAELVQIFLRIGDIGVDLFFVLSGYLIYGTLISRPFIYFKFMKRRVIRIYPAFLAVFFVYLMLSILFPERSRIPDDPRNAAVYLLQNVLLFPGIFKIEAIITVAWSLSYEMFFYITMPIVIRVFNMQRWNWVSRAVSLLALSGAALPILSNVGGPVRLVMFGSGAVLFELLRDRQGNISSSTVGFVALGAGLAVPFIPISGVAGTVVRIGCLYASFFALCYSCFSASTGQWITRVFTFTPLRWLGNMSYSYYLVHGLTLNGVFMLTGKIFHGAEIGLTGFLLLLPVYFMVTLVASAIPYILIELRYSLKKAPR